MTVEHPTIKPVKLLAEGRVALYRGIGSERCLVCRWRAHPSVYVGQLGRFTDDGLPERFPACGQEHALMLMRAIWEHALNGEGV